MERFDLYRKDHVAIGRTADRGAKLADDEFGLIVHVWIQSEDNHYLITRRAMEKTFGGLWECPGGGVIAGESSLDAALREVREETGLILKPAHGTCIHACLYESIHMICDVWLFKQAIDLSMANPQREEVMDIRLATAEEIRSLCRSRAFVPVYGYLDML